MFGSSRRALLARWCGVGSKPQQQLRVVPPSGRQQPLPLQQFASWFHTTARTCNKTDWDYYEQLTAGRTKGTNTNTSSSSSGGTTTSTSQKTSPKPSIYDVHKLPRSSLYPPRPTTASAPLPPSSPPAPVVTDKHRSEWDHGDWKRYRQQYGRQSHRPSTTALDEVNDDPEDPTERRHHHNRRGSRSRDTNPTRPAPRDDDEEEEQPRRYSGRDNHQPHSNRTRHSARSATVVVPLQTDEAGRRFRQSTAEEEEEDASSSSSSWYNNRYDRSRMIPRNGEASVGARSNPPSAPYFAQYTKPHVPANPQGKQQQQPQRGRPTMTTNPDARTRMYDQERRQAEELIWKSTPIVDEDGEYYMDDNSKDEDEDEPDSDFDEEDYPEKVKEEEDLAVPEKGPSERKPATAEESMFPPHFMSAYISCHKGLEFFLHRELTELGVAHHMHKSYGAQLLGPITAKDIMNCHLYLGTASNIFLRCGDTFNARALGELRRKVTSMPWANILQLNEQQPQQPPKFKVKVSSAKSRLMHTSAIRDQMLSGIYESLGFMEIAEKLKDHTKPKEEKLHAMGMDNKDDDGKDKDDDNEQDYNEEDDGADDVVRLSIHFFRDRAQISIDTSATPIHQRAYRLETCKAPLREDLSFAFLLSAGWKPSYFGLDRWDMPQLETEETSPKMKDLPLLTAPPPQYTSFLDPFCGSGTIAIEAAAMAAGLPPGRLRPAPLAGTKLYDPQLWKSLVQEGLQRSAAIDNNIRIYASDRDRGAVKATLSNAQRAGVLGFIETRECAFSNHPWLDDPTSAPDNLLLASNLPWGKRLKMPAHKQLDHKMKSLLPMYQRIATHCNAFTKLEKKADAIFLTDFPEVFRAVDFQAEFDETFASSSGGIKCQGVKVKLNQIKRPGFKAGEKNKGQPPADDNKEDKTPNGLSAKIDEEEKKAMLVS